MGTTNTKTISDVIHIDHQRRLATIKVSPTLSFAHFQAAMDRVGSSLLSLNGQGPWAAIIELQPEIFATQSAAGAFLRAFRNLAGLGSLTAVAWVQAGAADSDQRFHGFIQACLQAELPNRRFRSRNEATAWIQSLLSS